MNPATSALLSLVIGGANALKDVVVPNRTGLSFNRIPHAPYAAERRKAKAKARRIAHRKSLHRRRK